MMKIENPKKVIIMFFNSPVRNMIKFGWILFLSGVIIMVRTIYFYFTSTAKIIDVLPWAVGSLVLMLVGAITILAMSPSD